MTHPTPDVLALLALGEEVDAADGQHIPTCEQCQAELVSLRHVVAVGRSTTEQDVLVAPSPAVWDRIRAEVQTSGGAPLDPGARPDAGASGPELRAERPSRRWPALVLAAALALVVGLGAGLLIPRVLDPGRGEVAATLNALPQWAGANGRATVETDASGGRTLVVSVDLPANRQVDGTMEVWMSDSRADDMVPMGKMSGLSGRFEIPPSFDLNTHSVVDVSLEPQNDPDPAHSDVSVVRGKLSL